MAHFVQPRRILRLRPRHGPPCCARHPIGPADPVDAIKFRMEQQNLTPIDLEPYIGSSGRVSEVLNRKRRLSLQMLNKLRNGLRIPYGSLLATG